MTEPVALDPQAEINRLREELARRVSELEACLEAQTLMRRKLREARDEIARLRVEHPRPGDLHHGPWEPT